MNIIFHLKILSLLALLTILFGCSQTSNSKKKKNLGKEKAIELDLEKIQERGYLTAILDNSSTGLFLYKGRTMGYEYDLLKLYAEKIGVELKINITVSLEEGFDKLQNGEGDILAYNLTVTKERKKRIAFTDYHNLVSTVLVQRKPDNWRKMKLHEIEKTLVRNPIELLDKAVYVRHHSSYKERMENLSEEIGGDIKIIEADKSVETEELVRRVANGEIDYTVAEEDIALVNATYYPNIDIETSVSFPQQIAWGVRKDSPLLLESLNGWIRQMKKTADYYVIYDKYFKSTKSSLRRIKSDYFSISSNELSPYDDIIKKESEALGWDWRLLAAQIYKESKFNKYAKSWAGAEGLMQLLPVTAAEYGVKDLIDPKDNIYAGTRHLIWLQNYWGERIADSVERQKIILASYNVGHGHVLDAQRLAEKYGKNPLIWDDNIEVMLLKKSNPKFFNDAVVKYGYCRGTEPVNYVRTIYFIYEEYKALLPDKPISQNTDQES